MAAAGGIHNHQPLVALTSRVDEWLTSHQLMAMIMANDPPTSLVDAQPHSYEVDQLTMMMGNLGHHGDQCVVHFCQR